MTIKHHPCAASLMSCSAGSMPEAFAAVMASHLSMCPSCRKEFAALDAIGEALFEALAPVPVDKPAPVVAMRAQEADDDNLTTTSARVGKMTFEGEVPGPLRPFIGGVFDAVAWRRLGPGSWQYRIPLENNERGELRLIKVAPGQMLPEHGHSGNELTLVLRGAFTDSSGTYGVGDVADLADDVEHAPIADPDMGCICLVAVEGKLKFKSPVARMVQPFTGM